MKLRAILGVVVMAVVGAGNAAAAAPGVYGQIDTQRFPKPQRINHKPVVIDRAGAARGPGQPIYLHVVPGEEWHWYSRCHAYDACALPVYFVTESWFLHTYLPAIGSRDGREQSYLEQAARQRGAERDHHDAHGED